ncbi:hypothetical protein Pla52n_51310 [Stieleria varia]|uniref:DUF429 domain-containing protein n=2 Tax=Stieleria varia TaxID=2528005 RepID=A0A5C6AF68_9BACT|nr:hypothetical protein Pla52n_51310 [Stieleria varia]
MGVDFSGAALSGKTAWCAQMRPIGVCADGLPRLRLDSLDRLGRLAGEDRREAVCGYLVDRISGGEKTFWGCDFPFGLPIELQLGDWPSQLEHVAEFSRDQGFAGIQGRSSVGAKDYGRHLVKLTQQRVSTMHTRRDTDRETQTPFDCYHYRIIYQTYHGMKDVLAPLAGRSDVAVLPFQYERLRSRKPVSRLVVEACPSSTLKRLGLPHQRYKQSGGKPPEAIHKRTRQVILKTITRWVELTPYRRRVIMNDSGGDALDAVLAGLGSWQDWAAADHQHLAGHHRYPVEGRVYA